MSEGESIQLKEDKSDSKKLTYTDKLKIQRKLMKCYTAELHALDLKFGPNKPGLLAA